MSAITRENLRHRTCVMHGDGTSIEMVSDRGFVELIKNLERASGGSHEALDNIYSMLNDHPFYVKSLEHMLERQTHEQYRSLVQHILLDYEFLTAFDLHYDIEDER